MSEPLTDEQMKHLRWIVRMAPENTIPKIELGQAVDEIDRLRARLVAVEGAAKRARELLGWQCPPGHEDELEAADADYGRLGLREPRTYE